jgi:hypothetical protein
MPYYYFPLNISQSLNLQMVYQTYHHVVQRFGCISCGPFLLLRLRPFCLSETAVGGCLNRDATGASTAQPCQLRCRGLVSADTCGPGRSTLACVLETVLTLPQPNMSKQPSILPLPQWLSVSVCPYCDTHLESQQCSLLPTFREATKQIHIWCFLI